MIRGKPKKRVYVHPNFHKALKIESAKRDMDMVDLSEELVGKLVPSLNIPKINPSSLPRPEKKKRRARFDFRI